MRHLAISAIGRDRPGIVAGVSRNLAEHRLNVEDSQMSVLRGRFAMMLIVAGDDAVDEAALGGDLERTRSELGLESVHVTAVDELDVGAAPEPSHLVSVYGADHPGILHAVSTALAERAVTITDLTTRISGSGDRPLYIMVIEVGIPADLAADELERALAAVGEQQGVEISLRAIEQDVL